MFRMCWGFEVDDESFGLGFIFIATTVTAALTLATRVRPYSRSPKPENPTPQTPIPQNIQLLPSKPFL